MQRRSGDFEVISSDLDDALETVSKNIIDFERNSFQLTWRATFLMKTFPLESLIRIPFEILF